jgi:hypothetical protein
MLLFVGAKLESRSAWQVCLILMAVVSVFAWASLLRRRRALSDTPTSRIASAAQGYVELFGRGKPLDEPPLLSHLTALPCLWYRYLVQEQTSDGKWRTVNQGESEASFIIEDGSSRCVVDVEGAEILTRHKETWTRDGYRNTEWKLLIDDRVYALGQFRTISGGTQELDSHADIAGLLGEWKKNKPDLLKRFDLNADGTLDMQEWALARQAARRAVEKLHREVRNEADVHTLSCPPEGQLYLLTNIDPDKLARRFLWWAIFQLSIFFGSLAGLAFV